MKVIPRAEHNDQLAMAAPDEVRLHQGFCFNKPMSRKAFEEMLEER